MNLIFHLLRLELIFLFVLAFHSLFSFPVNSLHGLVYRRACSWLCFALKKSPVHLSWLEGRNTAGPAASSMFQNF